MDANQVAVINANNLELNFGDQIIVGLDISSSMSASDCPLGIGGVTRIAYVTEMLPAFLAEAVKYDPDGISIHLFGARVHSYPDTTQDKIADLIKNIELEPSTETALVVRAMYAEHKSKGSEQTFCFLFTDGNPNNREAVENEIIKITKELKDPLEFRICFILVGNTPADLNAWLHALDDELTKKGAVADIVSVGRLETTDFIQAVTSALAGGDKKFHAGTTTQ